MRYEEYFELSERTGWRVTELDWSALRRDDEAGQVGEFDRQALLGTAVIEHGVPHYGEVWSLVPRLREHWELWQFTSLWTGEESRHSYALKKACELLRIDGLSDDLEKVAAFRFAEMQKQSCPSDCYRSVPGMLAYTVIQELATHKFYGLAAKRTSSPFLGRLFQLIAGDEMRHHVFYREALKTLYAESREKDWYVDQVYQAARAFKMPHLVYGLQMEFFEEGDWSLGTLGKLAFKAQLARCFAFDAGLLARLLRDKADANLHQSGKRTPVLADSRP